MKAIMRVPIGGGVPVEGEAGAKIQDEQTPPNPTAALEATLVRLEYDVVLLRQQIATIKQAFASTAKTPPAGHLGVSQKRQPPASQTPRQHSRAPKGGNRAGKAGAARNQSQHATLGIGRSENLRQGMKLGGLRTADGGFKSGKRR